MQKPIRFLALALLLITCAVLSGCSGEKKAAQLPTCDAVVTAVQSAQPFEEMTPLSKEKLARRLDIDPALLADQSMAMDATRTTAECIVVLKATDDGALKTLEQALASYRNAVLEQYRDYQPDEVPKLENAILRSNGPQTVLVVSSDAAKVRQALDEIWK